MTLIFYIFLGSFLDFYGKTRLLRDIALLKANTSPQSLCTHFGDPLPLGLRAYLMYAPLCTYSSEMRLNQRI